MDQYALGRLRVAALQPFDINILSSLMKTGGEFGLLIEGVVEDKRDRVLAGLGSLCDRNLIVVDEARSTTSRIILRLTDHGRAVCAELEKMSVQPRVEVQMHGDSPEVVKP